MCLPDKNIHLVSFVDKMQLSRYKMHSNIQFTRSDCDRIFIFSNRGFDIWPTTNPRGASSPLHKLKPNKVFPKWILVWPHKGYLFILYFYIIVNVEPCTSSIPNTYSNVDIPLWICIVLSFELCLSHIILFNLMELKYEFKGI